MTYREYQLDKTMRELHRRLGYCGRRLRPTGTQFWRFEFLNAITNSFTE